MHVFTVDAAEFRTATFGLAIILVVVSPADSEGFLSAVKDM
jgi:hypothetical protein